MRAHFGPIGLTREKTTTTQNQTWQKPLCIIPFGQVADEGPRIRIISRSSHCRLSINVTPDHRETQGFGLICWASPRKALQLRLCRSCAVRTRTVVGANRAAFVVWNHWIGAVGYFLADNLVAHNGAAVAHADLAWFGFPDVPVIVDLTVQRAAYARAWGSKIEQSSLAWELNLRTSFHKLHDKRFKMDRNLFEPVTTGQLHDWCRRGLLLLFFVGIMAIIFKNDTVRIYELTYR